MKTRMFQHSPIAASLAVLAALLTQFAASSAFAAGPYYYDNVAGAGFGTAGGTWAAPTPGPTPGWNTDSTGAATPGSVTTGTGDAINFGTASAGLATGSITVSGASAGSLTYGSASGAVTLTGGTLTLGATATIVNNVTGSTQPLNTQLSGASTSLTLSGNSFSFGTGGAAANNTSGDLYINLLAGKSAAFSAANSGWGSGKNCYITGGSVTLANSAALGSYTINLGDTSVNNNTTTLTVQGTSVNVANSLTVVSGLTGAATLGCANNSQTFSGNITANDNLLILENQSGGGFTISGTASTIANGKTVTFSDTGTVTLTDSAIWGGLGSIAYGGNNNGGFTVSGAKTYSGGCTLNAMSGAGAIAATTSSTGSANNPTDGAFGKGTLSLGATKLRGSTGGATTFHNSITFIGNPTFINIASEKNLIFTGDASLGASRTITANIGASVAGIYVDFQGVISGSGFGITQNGTGNLKLSGANTYSGNTLVSSGKILLGNNLALQNSTFDTASVNGGLVMTGFTTPTLGGLTGSVNLSSTLITGYGSVTALTLNPGTGATPSYSGIVANGSGNMTLTKTGAGTQTFTGANSYSGATAINAGTLALGVGGSINNTPSISIAAGATFDVNALTTYTLSSSTTLSASGTGTTAGTTAAIIKGGTTVNLGSQGITLTWAGGISGDTTHPPLVISQGALTLSGNVITINGPSKLQTGVYPQRHGHVRSSARQRHDHQRWQHRHRGCWRQPQPGC